ncbi:MAG: hypothetical protein M1553_07485 [Firmicutes bacterium]|nr:hypothetical protein [Bacillota bacterium]
MRCPICGSRSIGKVGTNQFFCWDCFVEFTDSKKGIQVYLVDQEGTLVSYGESQRDAIYGLSEASLPDNDKTTAEVPEKEPVGDVVNR